jgi:uncharacterized protein
MQNRHFAGVNIAQTAIKSGANMKTQDLVAIDMHTHLEVSCRNPFDNYGEEYDRAADKYFKNAKRPTMQETIDYYRERKIGFVNFTVDAESNLGRTRITKPQQRTQTS